MVEHPLTAEILGKEFTIALFMDDRRQRSRNRQAISWIHCSLLPVPGIMPGLSNCSLNSWMMKVRCQRHGMVVIPSRGYRSKTTELSAVTRVKDLLIMSFNERILRKSLDFYDRGTSLMSEVQRLQSDCRGMQKLRLYYLSQYHQKYRSVCRKNAGFPK